MKNGIKLEAVQEHIKMNVTFYVGTKKYTTLKVAYQGTMGSNYVNPEVNKGYRFVGWYLSDKSTEITSTTVISSDITVYAKVEQVTYLIKLRTEDDPNIDWNTIQIHYGDTINTSSIGYPEVAGKTFVGWYDSNGNRIIKANGEGNTGYKTYSFEGDIILCAKYSN